MFINDDERGLHADYEDWLEDVRSKLRQAPHEPTSRYRHNRAGEACPERSRPEAGVGEDHWRPHLSEESLNGAIMQMISTRG